MAKPGYPGKPTKLRLLNNERPNRINFDEPPAPDGVPQCPDDAADDVQQVWNYTIANLLVMGVATPADRDALRVYCEAVVTHRKACALLAKSPIVLPGAVKNTIVQNAAVRIQRDAAAMIRAYAHEFGLTPAARSEIRRGTASHTPENSRYLNA